MMIDTSALIAILRNEADASRFAEAIVDAPSRRMSAASYVETAIVIDAAGDAIASRNVDTLIAVSAITIEPVTAEQARIARDAYRDFGRSSGHPARLNFGDCFSYALARQTREPLLFKGDDFGRTDVRRA